MFTTEEQRELFNQILDANYEASKETDSVRRLELDLKVSNMLSQLETLMGTEAYNTFMRRGKQMFAPIQ